MERQRIQEGYDAIAEAYADHFSDELAHKPFDRMWLDRFATLTAGTRVCDLGCGPGQVAAYLHARGADVLGADLSDGMLRQARRLHPSIEFRREDMQALTFANDSLGGIAAFYAIVNLNPDQAEAAFRECRRVLAPGGHLLLAFHVGDELRHLTHAYGSDLSLHTQRLQPDRVAGLLEEAGLALQARLVRAPEPPETVPQAYLLAGR